MQDRPGGLWYQELPRRALLLRLSKMAARAVIALALAGGAEALQNGLGLTPPMGYSSWNDCASEITEARVKNITRAMISTGLAAKGFVHINVDEGWLKGRSPNGSIFEDRVKFPSGMKALGAALSAVPARCSLLAASCLLPAPPCSAVLRLSCVRPGQPRLTTRAAIRQASGSTTRRCRAKARS